ncbi:MAG: glycosyltransferase family 2 protein [Candidatus Methanomethylicaceae archaeon]
MENSEKFNYVSIIIPCYNEERFIDSCLESLIDQDYLKENKDKVEIIIVDGLSKDRTREIIEDYSKRYPFIKILNNPKRITPTAMNIGIKSSRGDIIIRIDAHSIYKKDYISKCIRYLQEYNADNVGGILITLPGGSSLIAKAIAMVLSHPFGIGNSYFRTGINEVKEVDTVPFGCYKREVFSKIGFFNENLIRNQDIEFNLRLKRAGGKILLVPDIICYYYARPSLRGLLKQNFENGFWVIYSLNYAEIPFSYRHLVPAVFFVSIILSLLMSLINRNMLYFLLSVLSVYTVLNLISSLSLSFIHGLKYFPFLLLTFPALHFSYGLGSLWGGVKLIFSKIRK